MSSTVRTRELSMRRIVPQFGLESDMGCCGGEFGDDAASNVVSAFNTPPTKVSMEPDHLINAPLQMNQSLRSANGIFHLTMQDDGNLVLYVGGKAYWATNTAGNKGAQAYMQDDGNLVVYGPWRKVLWASGSSGTGKGKLVMQNDGNLVIYNPSGKAVWASGTVFHHH